MYPAHMTAAVARDFFGRVTATDSTVYSFNEDGPVSQAWLEFGNARDSFPALKRVNISSAGAKWFVFEGGMVLYQASAGAPVELIGG